MATTYNPYNDLTNIVKQKGTYNERRYGENPGDYQQAQNNAVQYYNSLVNNGQNGLAQEMQNASYERALEILARYSPDSLSQTPVTDDYGTKAASYLDSISSQLKPSDATTAALGTANGAAGTLLNSYLSGVNNAQGKSDALYNDIGNFANRQEQRYDNLNNYNLTTNPYTSEIGQSIMSNYQLQGYNASQNAVADSSGDNGGNIDSYAAANANRQQLAFTNAGNAAVLNDFNSRVANSLSILSSLGVDVGSAQERQQTAISADDARNATTLSGMNTAMQTAVNGSVASDEVRTNAVTELMSQLNSLAQQEVSAALTRDGYVSEQELARIEGELQTTLMQMGADADQAAAAAELALQQLKNEGALAEADLVGQYDLAGREIAGQYSLAGTQATANANLEGTMYKADRDYDANADNIVNEQIQYWATRNTNRTDSTNPTYNWIGEVFEELYSSNALSANPLLSDSREATINNIKDAMLNDDTLKPFASLIEAYVAKKIAQGDTTTASTTTGTTPSTSTSTNVSGSSLFN